jgi:hypothetical protein
MGRVVVAMVKCPEHKVFDEPRGRYAAQTKLSAGYYQHKNIALGSPSETSDVF